MDAIVVNLIGDIPPMTKIWTLGCIGVSVLTSTQIIDTTKTLYNFDLVFKKGQYGRLLYSIFDYGEFNWNTMLNLYITTTHLTMLENSFTNRNRYIWYITILFISILSMSIYEQPLSSLGSILQENLVYFNLKKNGSQLQFQLIGGIDISPLLIPIYMNAFMYFVYKRSLFQIGMNFIPAHLLFYFDDIISSIYNIDLGKPPTEWWTRDAPANNDNSTDNSTENNTGNNTENITENNNNNETENNNAEQSQHQEARDTNRNNDSEHYNQDTNRNEITESNDHNIPHRHLNEQRQSELIGIDNHSNENSEKDILSNEQVKLSARNNSLYNDELSSKLLSRQSYKQVNDDDHIINELEEMADNIEEIIHKGSTLSNDTDDEDTQLLQRHT
ncbi:hypothetical protein TBLA_0A00590 [Henningerozyma blattae CBS 6284]|uniref:Derlin n=1 Tax=Henningerozyma blattae (strain ATCC 34711 / CBS 6284 / DSM 70876 / NBRC 10599 / NRRL Y-10934 / UCD 77-7) TaxID=1071380 RepID=I2GUQ8_HENB6|nr:hypothetical protein TBLA_0A00590 [Tetrapisispora blattae CBS 6284]CCH57860.1 hypothetical protein TBLA_0A00590 [Tetrapisispora blattae CBS 6284]